MYYSGMNWPIRKINIFESQRRNATTIIIDDEQTHTTRHQTGLGCVLPAACGCLSGTLAQRGLNGSTNGSHERVGRTFFTSVCAFAAWLGCRAVFFFFFFSSCQNKFYSAPTTRGAVQPRHCCLVRGTQQRPNMANMVTCVFAVSSLVVATLFNFALARSQCLTNSDCVDGSTPLTCVIEEGATVGNCADSEGHTCSCLSACSAGTNSQCYTTTAEDEWQYCSSCDEWNGYDENAYYCATSACTDDASCYQDLPCSMNAGCTYYCENRAVSGCECQTACAYGPRDETQGWCFTSTYYWTGYDSEWSTTEQMWQYCSQCSPQNGIYGTSTVYSPCIRDSDCASSDWLCYQNGVCGAPKYDYCKYYYCGEGDGNCNSDEECVGDLVCGKENCDPGRYPSTFPAPNCCVSPDSPGTTPRPSDTSTIFSSAATEASSTDSAATESPSTDSAPTPICSEATCSDLTPCDKLTDKELQTKKGCSACLDCTSTSQPPATMAGSPNPCEWWTC